MQIQNEDATRIIRDGAKLTLAEGFPAVLLPNVVPVMDMTPRFHRLVTNVGASSVTATGAGNIYTAASDKDTYISSMCLSFTKDATCDAASGRVTINAVFNGQAKIVLALSLLTLTAQDKEVVVNLNPPIKVDKGSSIAFGSNTYTVGSMCRTASLTTYEVV